MIKGTFKFAGDIINVIVNGNNIMYEINGTITTLEGLRIDKSGVIKEFPDLKDDEEWKKKGIERLKEHIKTFDTEMKKLNYIKEELIKFGNEPLYYQQAGFRSKKW